jgi:U3 small nucleolar RNA-associated protein 6
MHKFKFNINLWKQYLDFCIKIQSKKQFYKTLSKSLRFLPFSEELWLIGVRYEI